MKYLILILTAGSLFISCASAKQTGDGEPGKKEARRVQLENDLDSLITNRMFDFVAIGHKSTFGKRAERPAPKGSGMVFRPDGFYTAQVLRNAKQMYYPENLTLVRDDDGWVVAFSFNYTGCGDPIQVYGCEGVLLYKLTVDKKGNARLEKSSSYSDHKYKEIYTGYITYNQTRW